MAYLSPITLILLVNFIVLITTVRALSIQTTIARSKKIKGTSKARVAVTFSVLLGCTWVFGLVAIMDLKFVFQVMFCLLNSLQGFFILVFFTLRSEDARKEWTKLWRKIKGACCGGENNNRAHQRNETIQLHDFLSTRTNSTKSLTPSM